LGQPLWLYTTATEAQWGMFALSCAYTFVWAFNAWTHWGSRPALARMSVFRRSHHWR